MNQEGKRRQEPLCDLIVDYLTVTLTRHLQGIRAARGGAPFTGPLSAALTELCERPYLSTRPDYEREGRRLFERFFRPPA